MNDTLKWIAVIVGLATGLGTNAFQFVGLTAPAQQKAERVEAEIRETAANSEVIRNSLEACMAELRKCYAECRQ